MIQNPADIAELHKLFMAAWIQGIRTVDAAFSEIRAEAGVEWIANKPNNRLPDRDGKDGFWREVDGNKFLIWKMTPR